MFAFRLVSPFGWSTWEKDNQARCSRGDVFRHLRNPWAYVHECGLYSFKSPAEARRESAGNRAFLSMAGSIFNYGVVVEHELGYRSTGALVDSLFTPTHLMGALRISYKWKGIVIPGWRKIVLSPEYGYFRSELDELEFESVPMELILDDLITYYRVTLI